MMEYRWNEKTNEFYLMELNSRFWGSLHLPILCGVDFPVILACAFCGKFRGWPIEEFSPPRQPSYPENIYCRWTFPADVNYLMSLLKDSKVTAARKFKAILEFVYLTLNPRVHDDFWFKGDRFLYFVNLKKFISEILKQ